MPSETAEVLAARYGSRLKLYATGTAMLGMVSAVLTTTIVNVAIPDIMGAFGIGHCKVIVSALGLGQCAKVKWGRVGAAQGNRARDIFDRAVVAFGKPLLVPAQGQQREPIEKPAIRRHGFQYGAVALDAPFGIVGDLLPDLHQLSFELTPDRRHVLHRGGRLRR